MFGGHTGHHQGQAQRQREKDEAALIGGDE